MKLLTYNTMVKQSNYEAPQAELLKVNFEQSIASETGGAGGEGVDWE